ncbi:putative nuclease HARBI1 [Leucoraja erinacea]|uniref:putative nuclease HARBI1 n=1 Tax=Leucoraja erinaceus TaxID=7782 RepID=UPI002455F9A7|nr:putative nuclease HARBI1 [Leucoraja erinacea]
MRKALEPGLRIAITLRYLASGDSYKSLSYNFLVTTNTICGIVRETCEAIIKFYAAEVMECPRTPDAWKRVALGFENSWNFAHTCGALDGKHVAICCPPRGGSNDFNYKKFHSIVLLAVVDHNYNFLYVDVGTPGSAGDGRIWKETWLGKKMEGGTAGMPDPEPLPGEDSPTPHMRWLLTKPLHYGPWIMKPYPQRNLTREQRIFNYRLSRARRVVENYFGILANRFRCLFKTMEQKPKNVETIVYAACVLHNLI